MVLGRGGGGGVLKSDLDASRPGPPSLPAPPAPSIGQTVLVEFEREVPVTGAAIREGEIITGGDGGSLRGVHPDTV